MMRFVSVLAAAAAAWVSPLSASVVPEPGHYGGGAVTFTLTQAGEIHNLRIHDRLVAHEAGHLVHGRKFHFNHRAQIFRYEGEGFWETDRQCDGSYAQSVPTSPAVKPAHYTWKAHHLTH